MCACVRVCVCACVRVCMCAGVCVRACGACVRACACGACMRACVRVYVNIMGHMHNFSSKHAKLLELQTNSKQTKKHCCIL